MYVSHKRPVREQLQPVLLARLRHPPQRPRVDERELHLVRHEADLAEARDQVLARLRQVRGVEVAQPDGGHGRRAGLG